MSNKRLRILNRQKSLKHCKQWYKGKKQYLVGRWTVEKIAKLECYHSLNLEEELSQILRQEIIKEFKDSGLDNPYPDEDVLESLQELSICIKQHNELR